MPKFDDCVLSFFTCFQSNEFVNDTFLFVMKKYPLPNYDSNICVEEESNIGRRCLFQNFQNCKN